MVLYAVYIAFILISIVPYIAEQHTRHEMEGENFLYHIVFEQDGDDVAHYFEVKLADNSTPGILDLKYYPTSHALDVDAINIQELKIDSESLYRDEAEVIVGKNYISDTDYYKQWFIDKEIFTVNVNTDTKMTRMEFSNVPLPVKVLVDGVEWWKTNTNYFAFEDDVVITEVPVGATKVMIYFTEEEGQNPTAMFTASKYITVPNEIITFDASGSFDLDGTIDHYIWEFGDGSQGSGKIFEHSFSGIGNFTVELTVRDNDFLEDTFSRAINIIRADIDTDGDGVVDILDPNPFEMLDTDGDGLSDDFEDVVSKTDKTIKDTDGDGWDDNIEWESDTDPNDSISHPIRSEKEDEEGIFGMGIMGDIASIMIIIVIILIIVIFFIMKKLKTANGLLTESVKFTTQKAKKPVQPSLDTFDKAEEDELNELEKELGTKTKFGGFHPREESEYECPTCGAGVNEEDTVCPKCGEEFI